MKISACLVWQSAHTKQRISLIAARNNMPPCSLIIAKNSDLTKKATYYQIYTPTNLWTNETYNAIRAQIVKSGATRIDGIGVFNGYTSAYSVAARSDYKYVGILFFSYNDFLTIVNTSDSGNSWITKNIAR